MKNNLFSKGVLGRAGKWSVALLAAASIAACGGGGSSSSKGGAGSEQLEPLTGRVADGYIQGATVCLDLNDNKRCDAGEPRAVTDTDGKFSIEGGSAEQRRTHALVAEVPEGAIDQDNPGAPIDARYVMSGTQGNHAFVSPLTTMVQSLLETNSARTADEVAKSLALQLGLDADADLLGDYIEKKETDPQYQRAHSVARVVAAVMASNHEAVERAAANIGAADKSAVLQRIVVKQAINNLADIVSAVEEAEQLGTTLDPKAVAKAVPTVEANDLEREIKREELSADQVVAPVWEILTDGLNEFNIVDEKASHYEHLRMWLEADDPKRVIHRFSKYENGAWGEAEHEGGEKRIRWIDGAWEQVDRPANLPVEFMNNGQAARLSFSEGDDVIAQGSWVELNGKPIKDLLEANTSKALPRSLDGASFGPGAKGVRLDLRQASELYSIRYFNPDEGWCHPDVALTGNCEFVPGSVHNPLTSLDELFDQPPGFSVQVGDYSNDIGLTLKGSADQKEGEAEFKWIDEGKTKTFKSRWERVSLGEDTEVIIVRKPASLIEYTSDSDSPYVLFAVDEGYVRTGSYIPEGVLDFAADMWSFNDAAMRDILQSMGIIDNNPFFRQ